MIIIIDKIFIKDISKIKDKNLLQNLNNLISDLEVATSLTEILNTKKIKGYKAFFSIRPGNYRMGIEKVSERKLCLIRFLHRKDVYKYFPKK